jgi:hypothetical protein
MVTNEPSLTDSFSTHASIATATAPLMEWMWRAENEMIGPLWKHSWEKSLLTILKNAVTVITLKSWRTSVSYFNFYWIIDKYNTT